MPGRTFRRLVMIAIMAAVILDPAASFAGTDMDLVDRKTRPIWHWTLSGDAPLAETIIVQGVKAGAEFQPQSAYLPALEDALPRHRPYLPLGEDILPLGSARVFGAEARITARSDSGLTLACQRGKHPAGIVLSFERAFPSSAAFDLAIEGLGDGVRFVLVRAGGDAERREDVIAEADFTSNRIAVPHGVGERDAQLVIVCPRHEATVTIASLRLEPRETARARDTAAWIWKPSDWQGRLNALRARLQEEGISQLFLQLPLEDPSALTALLPMLRALREDGVRLVAVEGDPAMVSDEGQRNAIHRARRLARFRTEHASLVDGVQYDVEPYLLASHAARPRQSWDRWAALMARLHRVAGERIATVVPFWMIRDPAARSALAATASHVDEYVVMAYRTDPAAVQAMAAPWLEELDGAATVRIALENGPLPVEFHRTYRRAEAGELKISSLDGTLRVELFAGSIAADGAGLTYAFSHEVEADPARVTFAGDRRRLDETGRTLLKNLAAWSNFRGLAYHAFLEVSER